MYVREISQMESITSHLGDSKPQVLSIQTCNIQTLIEGGSYIYLTDCALMHSVHISMDHFDYVYDIQCDGNQLKQVFYKHIKNGDRSVQNGGNIFNHKKPLEDHFI